VDPEELEDGAATTKRRGQPGLNPSKLIVVLFISFLAVGAVYYFTEIYRLPNSDGECSVLGRVENPYIFKSSEFEGHEVTIVAELNGSFTHVEPMNYTGVPLHLLLQRAEPRPGATTVEIIASDGYSALFPFSDASSSDIIILVNVDGRLRLVAAGYDGSYWVRNVAEVRVS
jgi:DMSO/TMAO reductase YedYZ molybdopterin-dependent catalytic subunit